MEELIELVLSVKEKTINWNANCKKRFYLDEVTLPVELTRVVNRIKSLLDEHLITAKGGVDYKNEETLEAFTDVKIITLEQDSFGPLIKGIVINRGVIAYG